MKTYAIEIRDGNDNLIGELMTATSSDIFKFLNKGFKVIDKMTGSELNTATVSDTIGVSDGFINIC